MWGPTVVFCVLVGVSFRHVHRVEGKGQVNAGTLAAVGALTIYVLSLAVVSHHRCWHSSGGQWEETGPGLGSQTALRALTIGMHSNSCRAYHRHAHGSRTSNGSRAGGPIGAHLEKLTPGTHKGWGSKLPLALAQLQRQGLAACVDPILWHGWGEGNEKGHKQLGSANAKTCGLKTSEIHRDPWWLYWSLVSSMGKVARSSVKSKSPGTLVADTGRPLPFFLVPSHLYTSQLCWSLGGWNQSRSFMEIPRKTGEAGPSPFPGEGNSLVSELPLGTEQCQVGGWGDRDKMKHSFFLFFCSCSQVFVPLCWSFLSWLLSIQNCL